MGGLNAFGLSLGRIFLSAQRPELFTLTSVKKKTKKTKNRYFLMLLQFGQFCQQAFRTHPIQLSSMKFEKHIPDQVRWEWRGGRDGLHVEAPQRS